MASYSSATPFTKPNQHSPDPIRYWPDYLGDYRPERFPVITGLRRKQRNDSYSSAELRVPNNDGAYRDILRNLQFENILAAAWGTLLLACSDMDTEDVTFNVAESTVCTRTTIPTRMTRKTDGLTNLEIVQEIAQHRQESQQQDFRRYLKHSIHSAQSQLRYPYTTIVPRRSEDNNNWKMSSKSDQDIMLLIARGGHDHGWTYSIHYPKALLDRECAMVLLQQLHGFFNKILWRPDASYENTLCPEQILPTAGGIPELPSTELLHHKFEHFARTTAESIALTFVTPRDGQLETQHWTYQQLNSAAFTLAYRLARSTNDQRNNPRIVPILIEKSPELYIAILAILKAGAAWCPIDTISPSPRQRDLIQRTGSSVVLVKGFVAMEAVPQNIEAIDVHQVLQEVREDSAGGVFLSEPDPKSAAYLIYTSGTTGPPKGVLVSHKAAVASMTSICGMIPGPQKADQLRCMQFSQQTFDVFVQDLFYTWSIGGTLISAPQDLMKGSFAALANFTKATHAHLTPAFAGTTPRGSCTTLEVVTMIGERLPQAVADDWGTKMLAFNTYGPAEAAVVSTVKQFHGKREPYSSSNIGTALPTMQFHVLRDGKPVLDFGIGELALSGPQLADGYLDNSEKTNEKFVWNQALNQRLYLTGDIVRKLPKGMLDFIGREDDLVKLQGIRVELSEISFAIRDVDERVQQIETMHLSRSDRPAKVLVSFMAVDLGTEPSVCGLLVSKRAAEIASQALVCANGKLPSYMQPSVILVLDAIPRTPSAKVDRKALQAAYDEVDLAEWESLMSSTTEESKNETAFSKQEQTVAEVIAKLLGTEMSIIRRSSVLPALGLDSIKALELSSSLRNQGISIDATCLLDCRTIDDLMSSISDKILQVQDPESDREFHDFDEYWRTVIGDHARDVVNILPTTSFQDSILIESFSNPSRYWSSHGLVLPSDIDYRQLETTWIALAQRTEALRVSFLPTEQFQQSEMSESLRTTFLQCVRSQAYVNFQVRNIDYGQLKSSAQDAAEAIAWKYSKEDGMRSPWAVTIFHSTTASTMLLTIHHSIHDEISLDLLFQDLWPIYKQEQSMLSPRPQLSDTVRRARWLRNSGSVVKYWQNVLSDYQGSVSCELPNLTGLDMREHQQGLIHTDSVIEVQGLTKQASSLQASVATIFRAAWAYLLLQYMEEKKVVIGDTLSTRLIYPELAGAIAPLVSVLPVPISATTCPRDLVANIEQAMLDGRKHHNITTKDINKILQRTANTSLYCAIFAFHAKSDETREATWARLDDLVELNVEHPLALNVYPLGTDEYKLQIYADKTKISTAHLSVLMKQVITAAEAITINPDQPWNRLIGATTESVMSISKHHNMLTLEAHNQHATFWLTQYAIQNPLWYAVDVAEEIIAGRTKVKHYTYKNLDDRSNQWARYLNSLGFKHAVVGVCLPRSFELYAVTVAILKSGNVYLPIEQNLPQKRKLLLISDSACSAVIINSSMRSTFHSVTAKVGIIEADIDHIRTTIDQQPAANIQLASVNDNAYLLYTSGSTGKPKGVLIPHRGLCEFVEGLYEFMARNSPRAVANGGTGKWLGLASSAFDVHLCEMFLGWRIGLSFATAPREVILDDLQTALLELEITHAAFVPSLLDQAAIQPKDVPRMVYFSVGGEKVSQRIIDIWGKQDQTLVLNTYGPTECSIGCCATVIHSQSTARNIGWPFGTTTAHVLLPDTLDYALKGQSGELCITGNLVGTGYLNRPDVKGFVDDFYGERMYRTGDIVRMLADGSLEYLGRADDQAKLRGQRIELGEIVQCLKNACQEDLDVVVLLLEHPQLPGTHLVAFLAPSQPRSKRYDAEPYSARNSVKISAQQLKNVCKKHLPAYMVPSHILFPSVLPLARISGKTDTKMLKRFFAGLELGQLLSQGEPDSQRRAMSEQERLVAVAVKEILHARGLQVHPRSNIFELGLDSLTAISLSLRLKRLGINAALPAIFASQTIEGLALLPRTVDEVENLLVQSSVLESFHQEFARSSLKTSNGIKYRPTLPLQEGLIARSLVHEHRGLYIHHVIVELPRGTNADKVYKSWILMERRSQILRTTFQTTTAGIIQMLHAQVEHTKVRFSTFGGRSALGRVQDQASAAIMDKLLELPPWEVNIICDEDGKMCFCLSIHHALYDAVSLNMLLNDVYRECKSQASLARTSFDAILGYYLEQSEDQQRDFWARYLEAFTPQSLTSHNSTEPRSLQKEFSVPLTQMQEMASRAKVTLHTLCLTISAAALAKQIGTVDIALGLIFSGRAIPIEGAEVIAGPCITTIPQRFNFGQGNRNLLDLARTTQENHGKMLQFQHAPLRKIQKWLGVEKVFDTLFQYVTAHNEPAEYETEWVVSESSMPDDYPLNLALRPDAENNVMYITISTVTSVAEIQTCEALFDDIDNLFKRLADDPDLNFENVNGTEHGNQFHQPNRSDQMEGPLTEQQTIIRRVLANYTGIEERNIEKHTSFFNLGIDSVAILELAKRLKNAGIQVRGSQLMQYPSISQTSRFLTDQDKILRSPSQYSETGLENKALVNVCDRLNLDLDTTETIYKCTSLQAGMLTATLASSGHMYVYEHVFDLGPRTQVDSGRLFRAWKSVVENHDILRTGFLYDTESSQPWTAVVYKNSSPCINKLFEYYVSRSLDRKAGMILNLTQASHFRLPPVACHDIYSEVDGIEHGLFVLTIHHALYDGISMPLICRDLRWHYANDKPLQAPPAFYEAARKITNTQASAVDFWSRHLRDYIPPIVTTKLKESQAVYIEQDLGLNVKDVIRGCQTIGVTIQTVAMLAYAKCLAKIYGQRDIVFGHVVSGRSLDIEGADSIVGPLFNTTAIRIGLGPTDCSNRDKLHEIQRFSGKSQDHQHAPLQDVLKSWRQYHHRAGNPVTALFLFQKFAEESDVDEYPRIYASGVTTVQPEYPLNVEIHQHKDSLRVVAAGYEDSYTNAELQGLIIDLAKCLENIIQKPDDSITSHPACLKDKPLRMSSKPLSSTIEEATRLDQKKLSILKGVVSKLSNVPPENLRPDTNIFALGLDSVLSIKVAFLCRNEGLRVSLTNIIQGETLAGICEMASRTETELQTVNGILSPSLANPMSGGIDETLIHDKLRCSSGQHFHLTKSRINVNEILPTFTYVAQQKLDLEKLRGAWTSLLQMNPLLRTVFAYSKGGAPLQVILKPKVTPADMIIIESSSDEDDQIYSTIHQFTRMEFAEDQCPVQLAILRQDFRDVMMLSIHHALYDAQSLQMIVEDLTSLYLENKPSSKTPFAEFVKQHQGVSSECKEHWQKCLKLVRPTLIPRSYAAQDNETAYVSLQGVIDAEEITYIAKKHEIQVQAIVIVAFSRHLARLTYNKDVVFGHYVSGRSTFPEGFLVCGPCMNVLPFVVREIDFDTATLTKQVHMDLAKLLPYEQSNIFEVLELADSLPVFNTYLNILWNISGHDNPETQNLLKPFDIDLDHFESLSEAHVDKTKQRKRDTDSQLPSAALYADIALVETSGKADINVRSEGGLMNKEDLRAWAVGLKQEIQNVIADLHSTCI